MAYGKIKKPLSFNLTDKSASLDYCMDAAFAYRQQRVLTQVSEGFKVLIFMKKAVTL